MSETALLKSVANFFFNSEWRESSSLVCFLASLDSFLAFLPGLLKDSTTSQSLQRPQASPGKFVQLF